MAIVVRNAFDLDGTFTVSGGVLRFSGVNYATDAPFPWRDLGVHPMDLYQLWLAQKVDCSSAAQVSPVDPTVDTEQAAAVASTELELGKKRGRGRSSRAAG